MIIINTVYTVQEDKSKGNMWFKELFLSIFSVIIILTFFKSKITENIYFIFLIKFPFAQYLCTL